MQYKVQDPQGNTRVIEGPDGASDDEVIAQAQQLFGQSGGMNPVDSGTAKIRAFLAASKIGSQPPIDPQEQTVNSSPFGQRLLENANTAAAGYSLPALAGGIVNGAQTGISWLAKLMNAGKAAEDLAPAGTALDAGLAAKASLASETAGSKATANSLYDLIPKDLTAPLITAQSTADSIINAAKDLPDSFQSSKILAMAGDMQDMNKASIGTIQTMNSALKDMATNGEGIEKVYAAQLSKALNTDLANFSKSALLPPESQGPSLEALALRNKWGQAAMEQSGTDAGTVGQYVRPDVFQPTTPASTLNNSDVAENLNKANSFYKDMSDLQSHPVVQALNRAPAENMAATVFNSGRVDNVNVAKAALGQQGFQQLQGQFFQQLLNKPNIGKAMAKYSPEFLDAALGPKMTAVLNAVDAQKQLVSKAVMLGKLGIGATAVGGTYEVGRKLIQ